jgi:hypothetical protein
MTGEAYNTRMNINGSLLRSVTKAESRLRRTTLVAALVTACLPAYAFAAKPAHPTTPANSHANSHANAGSTASTSSSASLHARMVLFVLHGTLSGYTAATSTTPGSVTIGVTSSNFHSGLKGSPITFTLKASTKVVLHRGNAISASDAGIVKVRAPKGSTATTLATLTPSQLIDQG